MTKIIVIVKKKLAQLGPISKIFIVLSILAISLIIYLLFKTNTKPLLTDNISSEIITYSTDNPSEEPPANNYIWHGNINDPKSIKLPSVGIEGYIQNIGVDQNSQMAVPNNVHFAGWFVDSVKPGEMGLSIIDGHLNGTTKGGIFRNLENLKKDDEFQVEMGNGIINNFKVLDVQAVDLEKAADVLYSQKPNVLSQLNLITCGGTYDKANHKYVQRIIVTSEFVGN